jgi:multidrug efflux pump subunit AcrB
MYPLNFLHLWNSGPEEGVLHVKFRPGGRLYDAALQEQLRSELRAQIPEAIFSLQPADIVSIALRLGADAIVEVKIRGPNLQNDRIVAERLKDKLDKIPSLRDLQFAQSFDYPTVEVTVDRVRSGVIGADITDVSRALIPATWSSRFETPNFWADPRTGIGYQVQTEIPQSAVRSVEQLRNVPIAEVKGRPVLLRDVARVREGTTVSEYDRHDMQRTITLRADVAGEPLSTVATRVAKAVRDSGPLPPRVNVALEGEVIPLQQLETSVKLGLSIAVLTIALLLLANFQSLRLTFAVMLVIPAVLAGVAVALWATRTTINIHSFIGGIMSVSVALANAILMITFAERSRMAGASSFEAGLDAARTRLRPILMTSLAMLAAMFPVALGWNDQTGQMSSLGAAVLGGVSAGTICTLLVLPLAFGMLQQFSSRRGVSLL